MSDAIWQELLKLQANLLALQNAHNALVGQVSQQLGESRQEANDRFIRLETELAELRKSREQAP